MNSTIEIGDEKPLDIEDLVQLTNDYTLLFELRSFRVLYLPTFL